MVKFEEEETYSFRLVCHEDEGRGGTLSECQSIASSKQRIDSLFRDRRPRQPPVPTPPPTPPLHPVRAELERMFGGRDQRQRAFQDVRATVQAQIERLFADASSEPLLPRKDKALIPQLSAAPPAPTRSPVMAQQPPPPPSPPLGIPSTWRDTPSPHQGELRYTVDYLGAAVVDGRASSLGALQEPLRDLYYQYCLAAGRGQAHPGAGQLHITQEGLAVTREDGRRVVCNPFPTIAVWAAVKLVTRCTSPGATHAYKYAFLPLISDPEAQDKGELFHPLRVPQPTLLAHRANHPPMLACVMRRLGVPRLLECHAFVCRSAEDAIVIAANLYQSLLRGMGGHSPPSNTPSDTYSDAPHDDECRSVLSDSEAVPVRPPRRKRTSSRASRRGGQPQHTLRRATSEDMLGTDRHSQRRLRRCVSEREGVGVSMGSIMSSGDVYTRVALPRSRSFMSVSDKYCLTELVSDATRDEAADEVLRQVVTPRGMSFSEMAPRQRQALLNLALTLSRDEMYQRSKNILRQQTRGRGSGSVSVSEGEWSSSTLSSVLRATKRSFSRLGSRASTLQSTYLRDKKLPLRRLAVPHSTPPRVGSRNGAPKTPKPRRVLSSRQGGEQSCSECGYDSECSSKCYCSLPCMDKGHTITRRGTNGRSKGGGGNGGGGGTGGPHHVPCDCDTESCAESEKCYCSLRRVRQDGLRLYAIDLDSETDTLNNNNNTTPPPPPPPLAPTLGQDTHPHSHSGTWRKGRSITPGSSPDTSTPRCHTPSPTHSTDSDTPRHAPPPPPPLISPGGRPRHNSGSLGSRGSRGSGVSSRGSSQGSASKILLVSAVDPSGRVVYRGASQRQQHHSHTQEGDTASILSMKKTAEIAALFSELKLNQTTDLLQADHHHHRHHDDDDEDDDDDDDEDYSMTANNSFLFSDNIETSLGYLP